MFYPPCRRSSLACAPYAEELFSKNSIQRALCTRLRHLIGGVCAGAVGYLSSRGGKRAEIRTNYELDPAGPTMLIAAAALIVCVVARPQRGLAAFASVLASVCCSS